MTKKTENLYWVGITLLGLPVLGWGVVFFAQVFGLLSGQNIAAGLGIALTLLLPVC